MNIKLKNFVRAFAGTVLLGSAVTVSADDTEMFFTSDIINPNVMFVLDVSGSMDADIPGTGKTRLEAMQSALNVVMQNAPDSLNVGLMNYGETKYYSGYRVGVKFPVSDIGSEAYPIVSESLPVSGGNINWAYSNIPKPEAATKVREYLPEITTWYWKNNWMRRPHQVRDTDHVGLTPIVEALFEAALYFRGDKVSWGRYKPWYSGSNISSSHPSTYEGDAIDFDHSVCTDGTRIRYRWHRPVRFNRNEDSWWRCPDPSGDLSIPGTYANCALQGNGRKVDKSYWRNTCQGGYSGGQCTKYSPPDESGQRHCIKRKPRTCPGGYKRTKITRYRHEYTACKGGYPSPKYISPIKGACQSSFIVLLSDGKPQYSRSYDYYGNRDGTNRRGRTYDYLRWGRFDALDNKTDATKTFDHTNCANNLTPSGFASGACGPELTRFLADNDQSDTEGLQTVDTFAIGFGLGNADSAPARYLKSLVTTTMKDADGHDVPAYFSAEDEEQLKTVFDNLLTKIGASTTALASPGYSVNVKSSASHNDDIYIPIFNKRLQPRWSGNLKKFKLKSFDNKNGSKSRKIVGKNGSVATSELGVFSKDAWDFWSKSNEADGRDVEKGGVASLLVSSKRNLFTNLDCTSNCDLSSKPLGLQQGNLSITKDHLGLTGKDATAAYRNRLLRFIGGQRWSAEDNKFIERRHMGDMMHSKPVVVNYTEAGKNQQVVFAGTNEGYLHAFDTSTGKELYAFMPDELLKNIDRQYKNSELRSHIYGIDGSISLWDKKDSKGKVVKKMLYFGMRRGGRSYYALDITNRLKPKLAWKITGDKTEGFDNLGQTWSNPYLARINTNDGLKPFLIFSGGYDENQDLYADSSKNPFEDADEKKHKVKSAKDSQGHDIYIVDAEKGPKGFAWSLKSSKISGTKELNHSIPGGMRMVDMNRDGAVDRLYFADTGGNVWRLDMPTGFEGSGSKSKGSTNMVFTHLADLSGDKAELRKFYTEPDVALMKYKGRYHLTVSIGSGFRSHPMDKTVDDRFYVIRDPNVYSIPESKEKRLIKDEDLIGTSMKIFDGVGELNKGSLAGKNLLDVSNKKGWYLDLPSDGEKVLATSLTRDGNILFTTLAPDVSSDESVGTGVIESNPCGAPPSQGRFYAINILTAEKMKTYDKEGHQVARPYIETVTDNEIPGSPQLIFGEPSCDENTQKCEQIIGARINKKASEVLNIDSSYVEPIYWSNPVRK